MNISPDDFEKFGIDSTILDDKKEQTTYKIRYVVRYVKQWAIIEAERPKINQINFVDCMCNAGVYKDGDFCTALEVIKVFNELAGNPKYQTKQFVVYLNDIDAGRIENFKKVILQVIEPNKNLHVWTSSMDVNDFLEKVSDSTHSLHNRLFAFGNCNLIYVDPYNFGTVQISRLQDILRNNYCELLFNLFTSDYVRNIAKDSGRIQNCLGGFKPATKDEFIDYVVNALRVGPIQYTFAYSFHTMKNVELYQILYATPNIRGLEVLKDSLWDVFDGEEFHRNHAPKISDVEQISMFDDEDPKEQRLREYAQEARRIICEEFKGQIVEYAVIEQKILEETMLKDSQIIEPVLKPLIDEEKIRKCNNVRKTNFKKDSYAFILVKKKEHENIRKSLIYKTAVEYGDYTLNHVTGCSHGCKYPCYAYMMAKRFKKVENYEEWIQPKLVDNIFPLLSRELPRYKDKIKTLHLCFSTDPYMYGHPDICNASTQIIEKANVFGVHCSVLTKGILPVELAKMPLKNEYGITVVTLDEDFRKEMEPGAAPVEDRIRALETLSKQGCYTWISIEPYPTPNIHEQNLEQLLERVSFANRIIFGRLHYNKQVTAYKGYQDFYNTCARKVIAFCEERKIAYHIKKGTLVE